jgi:hypothetical protein
MELENVRKLAEKMQEDTEELERERGTSHVVGVQERLLRMEKVESLSHLYLGGLEEVHADLFNVKLSCHDHIDKLEEQWKQFQQHEHQEKDSSREELGSSAPPQVSCITYFPFQLQPHEQCLQVGQCKKKKKDLSPQ